MTYSDKVVDTRTLRQRLSDGGRRFLSNHR
jgi:hypothetical protein